MPKPVVIISDSACDLSPELIEKYSIEIIPMNVIYDGVSYRDGIEMLPDEIYDRYYADGTLPKTAAVNPDLCADIFKKHTDAGEAIVYICISSCFSSNCQNGAIAASDLEDVYVVDSLNLSTGIGLQVLRAAELRDQGLEAKVIAERIQALTPHVSASFILDNLEFLHKGGRCSAVAALGANLLKLKPCIEVTSGKMGVGKKYRGKLEAVLQQYTKDKLASYSKLDLKRVFITHSGMSQQYIDLVKKTVEECADFEEILITRAGSTISSHCGPNTLGVLFITEDLV